jgi:bifunctional non-homologous end joining protein LigD
MRLEGSVKSAGIALQVEIKHDGHRLMARRDPVGIRLITRRGNDWTTRFPLVIETVNHLKVRFFLIDGEVVRCDAQGVTSVRRLHAKIVIN